MKKYSYLAGAAFLAIASSASFASITLQVTTVAINTTLSNAGWVGYELTLVADGTNSMGVAGADFNNVLAVAGMPQSNIGISGDIHQQWTIDNVTWVANGSTGPIPRDPTPMQTAIPGSQNAVKDSFWFEPIQPANPPTHPNAFPGYFSDPNPPSEDNNLTNGTNPPFTRSPIADNAGIVGTAPSNTSNGADYGVGSLMTFAGSFYGVPNIPGSVALAFIIVPSSVPTTINGVAVDENSADFAIETTLGTTVPEPTSVGLVGLGGLALLARRRRKV